MTNKQGRAAQGGGWRDPNADPNNLLQTFTFPVTCSSLALAICLLGSRASAQHGEIAGADAGAGDVVGEGVEHGAELSSQRRDAGSQHGGTGSLAKHGPDAQDGERAPAHQHQSKEGQTQLSDRQTRENKQS